MSHTQTPYSLLFTAHMSSAHIIYNMSAYDMFGISTVVVYSWIYRYYIQKKDNREMEMKNERNK